MMITIGERLMLIRRRLNASQSDVARKSGVHRNTISAIERGDMNIKLSTLIAVCNALGLDIEVKLEPKDKEGGEG